MREREGERGREREREREEKRKEDVINKFILWFVDSVVSADLTSIESTWIQVTLERDTVSNYRPTENIL